MLLAASVIPIVKRSTVFFIFVILRAEAWQGVRRHSTKWMAETGLRKSNRYLARVVAG
jgi:hypothetical protein